MLPLCDKCGRTLRISQVIYCWRRRSSLSYPSRAMTGERAEQPVHWLCHRCQARAERHRDDAAPDTQPDGHHETQQQEG